MRARFEILWISVVFFLRTAGLLFAGEAQDAFEAGVKFYRAGKFKDAIAAYDRTIKAGPKAAEAYLGRWTADATVAKAHQEKKNTQQTIRLSRDHQYSKYNRDTEK